MGDLIQERNRFQKSFLLHSSRYNLYSKETLEKGSVGKHNRAVTAMGILTDRVIANPSLYSELLLKWLEDHDPKVRLCAAFTCLHANIHGEKSIDVLISISRNITGKSMICDFDIAGSITQYRKKLMEANPRNEIDEIADMMKVSDVGTVYTDAEIFDKILNLSDINMRGHDGRTSLIHACHFNRFELIKKLIEQGADVNVKDLNQKNALHCAAIIGNSEVVSLLLNQKVKVNEPEKNGWTALDFAKFNPNGLSQDKVDQLTKLLISGGAKTKYEQTKKTQGGGSGS
jgi:hypothetical protein